MDIIKSNLIKFKTNLTQQMIIGSGKYPKNDYSF